MTEQLTRRQMREAERGGAPAAVAQTQSEITLPASDNNKTTPATNSVQPAPPLTRRALREQGLLAKSSEERVKPAQVEAESRPQIPREAAAGSRRSFRNQEVQSIEAPDVSIAEPEFTGSNLLAEPSTESIVLDRAPEAIELPIETGEITVTGSIQIVTDSNSQVSTSTDAIDLDTELDEEAVTGVLSTTEPISALALIGERSSTGVVPASMNRGRWKPVAFAAGSVALAVATIWATLVIIGAAG